MRAPASSGLTEGSRKPTTWARHFAGPSYCAVDSVDSSVHTACRGRWPSQDNATIHDNPPLKERCGGCVRALLTRALREFGDACVEMSAQAERVATAMRAANATLIEFLIADALLFESERVEGEWE